MSETSIANIPTAQKDVMPSWSESFLTELKASCNVTEAAKAAKIDRTSAYDHKKKNRAFSAAWDSAVEVATDDLEDAVRRRAMRQDPADKGSALLGIFMLKARRRDLFGERTELKISGGLAVQASDDALKAQLNEFVVAKQTVTTAENKPNV